MLEFLGFRHCERHLVPWFFLAFAVAMMIGFAVLNFVERNPPRPAIIVAEDVVYDSPPGRPEVLYRLARKPR